MMENIINSFLLDHTFDIELYGEEVLFKVNINAYIIMRLLRKKIAENISSIKNISSIEDRYAFGLNLEIDFLSRTIIINGKTQLPLYIGRSNNQVVWTTDYNNWKNRKYFEEIFNQFTIINNSEVLMKKDT